MHSALLAAALALGSAAAPGPAATLQLAVNHHAGADPLILDSLRYRNRAEEDWSVARLSYLISGLSLQREDGTWFSSPDSVAWMFHALSSPELQQAARAKAAIKLKQR